MRWNSRKAQLSPMLTNMLATNTAALYLQLDVRTDQTVISVGARIARSSDRSILDDIVHYYASHMAYNIPVETYPQPHVMLPVPSPAILLLAQTRVSLDVPMIGSCLRIMMHSVVLNSHIDFYTTRATVTVVRADVLYNW